MATAQRADDRLVFATQSSGYYSRPAWTAELRLIEALILARSAGVTWS